MSQATFAHESGGTTIYVSIGKVPPIQRVCQVCGVPLSGRGMWKFCKEHAQEAYVVDKRIRERRRDDSLHVEFWTRVAAEDYTEAAGRLCREESGPDASLQGSDGAESGSLPWQGGGGE